MKTLNFICPWCMGQRSHKVDISCEYENDALFIPWECPCCKFRGVWERQHRKPILLHRIIEKIKGMFK